MGRGHQRPGGLTSPTPDTRAPVGAGGETPPVPAGAPAPELLPAPGELSTSVVRDA